ncbi:MAG: hypothetical protein P4N41_00455 [Negativicutes bacterium]|nr:hypothetical protein [Negativicutes bacterium]
MFWYCLVTATGLGMTGFTMLVRRNLSLIALVFFLMLSFLTVGEFLVLTVFDAYAYKLGIYTDYFADNVLGYVLGNWLVWTGAANLVVNFSLGNPWIFLLAVLFMLIEVLFLHLGIYENHWWRTYLTGGIVFVGLNVIKIWIAKLEKKTYNFLRYMTCYLLALLFIHAPTHLLLLGGKQHYTFGFVENSYRDSILFALPYHAGMSLIFVFFGCALENRLWRFAPVLLFLLSDILLINLNILVLQEQWNFFCLVVFRSMSLVLFYLYKKYNHTGLLTIKKVV